MLSAGVHPRGGIVSCLLDWMLSALIPLHILAMPSKVWPDGGLGSVNFYNLFEGHLERDFDSHQNNITLEPNNLFWGNLAWGTSPVEGKALCMKVLIATLYIIMKNWERESYLTFVIVGFLQRVRWRYFTDEEAEVEEIKWLAGEFRVTEKLKEGRIQTWSYAFL